MFLPLWHISRVTTLFLTFICSVTEKLIIGNERGKGKTFTESLRTLQKTDLARSMLVFLDCVTVPYCRAETSFRLVIFVISQRSGPSGVNSKMIALVNTQSLLRQKVNYVARTEYANSTRMKRWAPQGTKAQILNGPQGIS